MASRLRQSPDLRSSTEHWPPSPLQRESEHGTRITSPFAETVIPQLGLRSRFHSVGQRQGGWPVIKLFEQRAHASRWDRPRFYALLTCGRPKELGKARGEVILLPDELLQDRAVVGHAIENAGRGQAIALQLTCKVARHHRASPVRAAPTSTHALQERCKAA